MSRHNLEKLLDSTNFITPDPRATYIAPQLTILGKAAELTKGNEALDNFDACTETGPQGHGPLTTCS